MPTDTKVTDFTELTAPVNTDKLIIIDDPSGSPVTKNIELGNVLKVAGGKISVTGGSGTQTPSAATWTKVTQFDAESSISNVTASHANDKITLTNAGYYLATWQVTFTGAADEYRLAIYWNGSIASLPLIITVPGTDEASGTVSTLINATSGTTDVEAYCYTVGGNVFDVKESELFVVRTTL